MDGMIQTGRFHEFVDSIIVMNQKEEEEKANWDFFLHKVFDSTYDEFKKDLEETKNIKNMSKKQIETTINHSMNILNNFNPNEPEGGE